MAYSTSDAQGITGIWVGLEMGGLMPAGVGDGVLNEPQ